MQSVKRNIIANSLGGAWSALMGFAFIPLYIHYLGIEAYGLVGIFVLLQAWLSIFDIGLTPMLSREMARLSAGEHTSQSIHDLLRSVEWVYLVIAVVIAVGIALAAPWLAADWLRAEHLSTITVARALTITGGVIAMRWLGGLYRSGIIGLQRQVWLNGCTAIFAGLRGGGAVLVLAWVSPTIEAFFAFQGIVIALEALVLAVQLRRLLPAAPRPARFHWQALHQVRRFAGGMAAIAMLAILLTQVDKLLLSRLLPLSAFGYYTLASTLAGALFMMVLPVRNATYPRLTELVVHGDALALAEAYHKFSQMLTLMIVPAALVMSLFAEHILLLWARDTATTNVVAPLASILVIGCMFNGLMNMPYTLQLAYGWTRLIVITNVIAVVVMVPSIYVGVSTYGVFAAAIIWIAINAGYVVFLVPLVHRKVLTGEMWHWYGQDVFVPLLAGLAVAVAVRIATPSPVLDRPLACALTVLVAATLTQLATVLATPLGRTQLRRLFPRPVAQ